MRGEIKYFIWAVGLGIGLVVYAQTNFTTKNEGRLLLKGLERINKNMDRIENKLDKLIFRRSR